MKFGLILVVASIGIFQISKGLAIQSELDNISKDRNSDETAKILDNIMVETKMVDNKNVDSETNNGRGGIIGTEIFDKDIIAAAMAQKEKTKYDGVEHVETGFVDKENVDKDNEEESETYSCIPWLFNPGLIYCQVRL